MKMNSCENKRRITLSSHKKVTVAKAICRSDYNSELKTDFIISETTKEEANENSEASFFESNDLFSVLCCLFLTSGFVFFLPGEASASSLVISDGLQIPFLPLAEINPETAKILSFVLRPLFSGLNFLFIIRIVMSWYPQLPVNKLPYSIVFTPTEPVLGPTRRLIPPVGGVDVAPVIWVAFMSFLNEILLGQQGLLILLSQKQF